MANVEISKKLVLINSVGTVVMRVLYVGLWFWLNSFVINHVSDEEYQLLPVMMSVMAFVQLLNPLLVSGIARFAVEAYARGDEQRVTQIVSSMFAVLSGVSVLILAPGLAFSWFINHFLTIADAQVWEARLMMGMMITFFCIRLPLLAFNIGPFMKQRFILRNGLELASQVLMAALVVGLLFGVSVRIIWLPLASGVAMLAEALVHGVISRRIVPAIRFRMSEIRLDIVKDLVRFGRWYFVGQIGAMLRDSTDSIVLNKMADSIQVNSFYIGSMADRQARGFMMAAMDPLRPALTAMHATGDRTGLGNAYLRVNRIALWLSLSMAVPLIVLSDWFFRLYLYRKFELYSSAPYVMMLTLATYPLIYSVCMVDFVAIAMARIRTVMLMLLGGQIVHLAATIVLVKVYGLGAKGAAVGALIGTGLTSLIYWRVGLRLLGLGFARFLQETLLPGLAPAVVGGIAWWLAAEYVEPTTWLRLIECGMAGGVVYLAALVLCLREADWNDVRRVTSRVRKKFWGDRTGTSSL